MCRKIHRRVIDEGDSQPYRGDLISQLILQAEPAVERAQADARRAARRLYFGACSGENVGASGGRRRKSVTICAELSSAWTLLTNAAWRRIARNISSIGGPTISGKRHPGFDSRLNFANCLEGL